MSQPDDRDVIRRAMGPDCFALWFEPRSPNHPAVIESRDFATDLADVLRQRAKEHDATIQRADANASMLRESDAAHRAALALLLEAFDVDDPTEAQPAANKHCGWCPAYPKAGEAHRSYCVWQRARTLLGIRP